NRTRLTRGLIILLARLTARKHDRVFLLCHYSVRELLATIRTHPSLRNDVHQIQTTNSAHSLCYAHGRDTRQRAESHRRIDSRGNPNDSEQTVPLSVPPRVNIWISVERLERATGVEPALPAWEFSIEISIFSFTNKTLSLIFRSQDLLLMSSNFNYFRLIYFCLGHVLGTRFLCETPFVSFPVLEAVLNRCMCVTAISMKFNCQSACARREYKHLTSAQVKINTSSGLLCLQ